MRARVYGWAIMPVLAGLLLAAGETSATRRWMSASTVNDYTRPLCAGTEYIILPDGERVDIITATVSNRLFDIVISLERKVKDESAWQERYERMIGYFADAVYEQSGGWHFLRNVSIYRGSTDDNADIVWRNSGHPGAKPRNQEGLDSFIWMYDDMGSRNFHSSDGNIEMAGYVLGHEWAHYAYGVLDEYGYVGTNTFNVFALPLGEQTRPSIMAYSWFAEGRNYEWLNHSIRPASVSLPFRCRWATHQRQVYGNGAWPTLIRDPAEDPLDDNIRLFHRQVYGTRLYFPELANVAPRGNDTPTINLSADVELDQLPSRRYLNIRWMQEKVLVVMLIETSSRMLASYEGYTWMQRAKWAAYRVVNNLKRHAYVGIIGHDNLGGSRGIVYPDESLGSTSKRAETLAAIDGIHARGGWTGSDFFNGFSAVSSMIRYFDSAHPNSMRIILLISDYYDCEDISPEAYANWFASGQVPIIFAQTRRARYPESEVLAGGTGGVYLSSLGLSMSSRVWRALRDVMSYLEANQNLVTGAQTFSAPSRARVDAAVVDIPFEVEAGMTNLTVMVEHAATNTVALRLRAPDDQMHDPVDTETGPGSINVDFLVATPAPGEWSITGTASADSEISYYVYATPLEDNVFSLTAVAADGHTAVYPDPVRIMARLRHGQRSVNGASVTAMITDPHDNTSALTLDNTFAGLYSAIFMPAVSGQYHVAVAADNSAGTAVYTSQGVLPVVLPDGTLPPLPPDEPVDTQFNRVAEFNVSVKDVENAVVPGRPSDVAATSGDGVDYVLVSWAALEDASKYEIWRASDAGMSGARQIAQVARNWNVYTDTNVKPGQRWYYRVRGVNVAGAGEFSTAVPGWSLLGPGIRVNDKRQKTLARGQGVDVVVMLRAGEYAGMVCDWWVAAYAEDYGVYFYLDENLQWQPAAGLEEVRPVHTGPIGNIDPYLILQHDALPAGTYRFYFGLDTIPNGILDTAPGVLYYDTAVLRVE